MPQLLHGLLQTGTYRALVTADAWRADFEEIRRVDAHAEAMASNWTIVAVLGALAAGVSFFFLAGDAVVSAVALAGVIGGVLAFVAGLVLRSRAKKHDFENRRYELANEVIRLLAADVEPQTRIGVRLDLRPLDGSKSIAKRKVNGWDEDHRADPFLQLSARLCDGSSVAVHVVQHERIRSRWKRSASGKSKHKSKKVGWLLATVKLKADPARAQAAVQAAKTNPKAIKLPYGAHLGGYRVTQKGLAGQAWSELPWVAPAMGGATLSGRDLVALLLVSTFQLLGQAEGAKSRSA